jgi:hypothetical protein
MKLLDNIFKKTFAEKTTEINESEIQDFKDKMINKLNFDKFCQDFETVPTILLKTIKY